MKPDILEQVYRQHRQKIFLCALAITGRRDLAEDAVHEGMARLCQSETEPDNPLWYVMTTVRNTAVDLCVKDQKQLKLARRFRIFRNHTAAGNESNQDPTFQKQVEQAFLHLSQDQREVLVLKLWGGLTFQEISEVLGKSPNTVASNYRRGLRKLREMKEL